MGEIRCKYLINQLEDGYIIGKIWWIHYHERATLARSKREFHSIFHSGLQPSVGGLITSDYGNHLGNLLLITPLANTFEQLPWQYSWNHSPYEYSGRTFSPATSNAWLCTWLVLFDFISSLNHTIFLPIEWKHKKVNQVKFNDFIWHKYRPNISTLSF